MPLPVASEPLPPRLRRPHLESVGGQVPLQRPRDPGLIRNHEDARAAGSAHARLGISPDAPSAVSGRANAKQAPPSGLFSAQIRPPCASTMPFATARPSPMPSDRPGLPGRLNGSNRRESASSEIPEPP